MPTELFANLDIQTKNIAVFVLQEGTLPIVNKVSLDSSFLSSFFLTAAFTAATSVSS